MKIPISKSQVSSEAPSTKSQFRILGVGTSLVSLSFEFGIYRAQGGHCA